MRKKLTAVVLAALIGLSFTSCNSLRGSVELPHFNGVTEDGAYDSKYFYRNDLHIFGGDPGAIWVPEERDEEDGGYFYMYTSGNDGVGLSFEPDESKSVITVLRSKDLNDWELCGNVAGGFACTIGAGEWIINQVWAPEVVYNETDEMYYLYCNGQSPRYQDKDGYRDFPDSGTQFDRFYGAVFMSESPCGPFELATSERYYGDAQIPNPNGKVITGLTPQIDPKHDCPGLKDDDDCYVEGDNLNSLFGIIDISPFIDEDGEMYVYFVRHPTPGDDNKGWNETQEVWGVKMKDMITPDWSTLRLLMHCNGSIVKYKGDTDPNGNYPNYKISSYSFEGALQSEDGTEGGWVTIGDQSYQMKRAPGEGCIMLKSQGRYYLTSTPGGFGNRNYVGMQNIGESPLGPFERLPMGPGEVVGVNETNDYMTGIGHAGYVEKDGEIFSLGFAHADPYDGTSAADDGRILCVDRVTFVDDPKYGRILYGNGPTNSLQPKVVSECNGGMKNIAGDAKITAKNANNDTIKYLNDGRFVALEYYQDQEFESKGETTITLEFDSPREIGAIMIYNSFDYDYAFSSVDLVQFTLAEKPSWYEGDSLESVHIQNLPFNTDYVNLEDRFMRAGGSALASFDPIKVTKITITISEKFRDTSKAIKVSDIVVLGR